MASVYTNDLRLEEIGSGEQSGSWGDTTNTNLELIAEAFAFGTEAITTNANTHTTTIADGATDPGRSLFLKYTGTLDSACTITIGPNTVSKLWFIENGTSGSQNIIIKQGSGATITVPPGDTKAIYSNGAGSGAAMVDAFASLSVVDLKVQDDLTVTDDAAIGGLATVGGTLGVTGIATFTDDIIIGDGKTIGSASDVDAMTIAANGQITLTQTLIGTALDISGDIDVDGTTNLDIVDVDGAVNFAADVTFANGADIITASAGTDNVRIGENAGNSIVSGGIRNIVIGKNTGTALTTGDENVAIGHEALITEDAHGKNVAIGNNALKTLNAGAEGFNTAVGFDAGKIMTTSIKNTLIGGSAGDGITSGDGLNVAIGYNSLGAGSNTTQENVAIGNDALSTEDGHGRNVAVGFEALKTLNAGALGLNTAVGQQAGKRVTTGIRNTLVGALSGDAITDSDFNVALGYASLSTNVLGSRNTAIGFGALETHNPVDGSGDAVAGDTYNVAVGHAAGTAVTTGIQNTFVGGLAGDATDDGNYNVAVGHLALSANCGDSNVAIGYDALLNYTGAESIGIGSDAFGVLTDGLANTAIGFQAGLYATTADQSTFVGHSAGKGITGAKLTGNNNTAVGASAGGSLQGAAASNTLVGTYSGIAITTASSNTAVGYEAIKTCSTGVGNTSLGQAAGFKVTNGDYNTFLGLYAGYYNGSTTGAGITTGHNNCYIGYLSYPTAVDVDNEFTLGNANTDNLRCADTSISALSDERDKTNIVNVPLGLDFINALRPVSFDWNTRDGSRSGRKDFGFIAQELKSAAAATDYVDHMRLTNDFKALINSDATGDSKSDSGGVEIDVIEADPMKTYPVLVKAVQELSTALDAALARIATLEG